MPTPTPTRRTRRTRRPPEARADEIVQTARRLFATRGFRGTTVAAVAADVGITDAGLLHHFPTKNALLKAVLDHHTQVGADQIRAILAPQGLDGIRGLAAWGEVMESQPHLLGFEIALSSEAIEPASDLHEFFTARYTVLRRWLMRTFQQGVDAGEIRPDVDPAHETSCFVALLDGLRLQWFFADGGVPIADRVRTYVDQLVARIEVP
ncbi:MAG TPA: TetR/AcrR family transcriptional regulator [Acidimicrobiales bacterium]|nr:TetR/AcrR family transcriptional regulator [Acidimicrobiales bacterium]